jgi:hypothetical protein
MELGRIPFWRFSPNMAETSMKGEMWEQLLFDRELHGADNVDSVEVLPWGAIVDFD